MKRKFLLPTILSLISFCSSSTLGQPSEQADLPHSSRAVPDDSSAVQGVADLMSQQKYAEAEVLAREQLPRLTEQYGEESPQVVQVLDYLVRARWHQEKSKDPETVALAEKTVRLTRAVFGAKSMKASTSLSLLGDILYRSGEYERAQKLLKEALAIQEKELGPEDPSLLRTLTRLSKALSFARQHSQAEEIEKRILSIREKEYGPDHPTVAHSLHTLGNYAADAEEAMAFYKRALAIYEKAYGPEDLKVATVLRGLASIYSEKGDHKEAKRLSNRALEIQKKAFGPESHQVARALLDFSNTLEAQGDYMEAGRLLEKVLAIQEKTLGPGNATLMATHRLLGMIKEKQRRYTEARDSHAQALSIATKTLPMMNPFVTSTIADLSRMHMHLGEYQAAEALYEELLKNAEAVFGKEHLEIARILKKLTEIVSAKGDAVGAVPLAERRVSILEGVKGPDHLDVSKALMDRAELYFDVLDIPAGRGDLERAIAILEAAFGKDDLPVGAALNQAALLFIGIDEGHEALPYLEQAITICEQSDKGRPSFLAMMYMNMAEAYAALGNALKALTFIETAIEYLKKPETSGKGPLWESDPRMKLFFQVALAKHLINSGNFDRGLNLLDQILLVAEENLASQNPPDRSDVYRLFQIGISMVNAGAKERGEALSLRAVQTVEEVLGPDHVDLAESLEKLALHYRNIGDYPRAQSYYERILAIKRKAFGDQHPEVGKTLKSFAALLKTMADYPEAKNLLEEALEISEETFGPEHRQTAGILNDLGLLLSAMGDYDTAIRTFERALKSLEGSEANDLYAGYGWTNLADTYYKAGMVDRGMTANKKALSISEEVVGPESKVAAGNLINLGLGQAKNGQYDEAQAHFERALRIFQKDPSAREYLCIVYQDMAFLMMKRREREETQRYLSRARAEFESVFGTKHPFFGAYLGSEALILAFAQEDDAALDAVSQGLAVYRDHVVLTARSLSERQSLLYASRLTWLRSVLLSLAAHNPVPPYVEKAVNGLVQTRGVILDEMAARNQVAWADDSEIQGLFEEAAAARNRLARLVMLGGQSTGGKRFQELLERAGREKDATERALAERSLAFRERSQSERIGLPDVIQALPQASVLIAFVRYEQIDFLAPGADQEHVGGPDMAGGKPSTTPSYVAFVLSPESQEPHLVFLGPAAEIDQALRADDVVHLSSGDSKDRIPVAGTARTPLHSRLH